MTASVKINKRSLEPFCVWIKRDKVTNTPQLFQDRGESETAKPNRLKHLSAPQLTCSFFFLLIYLTTYLHYT